MSTCRIEDCPGGARWRGMCSKHYTRWRYTGSTVLSMESRPARLEALQDAHIAACGGQPIPGHPGFFASAEGVIYTVLGGRGIRPKPLPLTTHLNKGGYPTVRLRGKSRTVHQLVALTFYGPPPVGQHVRHLNGVSTDPRLENLRYGTPRENAADRVAHGTMLYGEAVSDRWTDAEVQEAVHLYLTTTMSQREVGELYGASQQAVSRWIKAVRLGTRSRYAATPDTAAAIAARAKAGRRGQW